MTNFARSARFSTLLLGLSALVPVSAKPVTPDDRVAVMSADRVPLRSALKAAWTQYGPGGVLEARAVVEGAACPDFVADLTRQPMQLRAKGDEKFLAICTVVIPPGTKQASFVVRNDQPAPNGGGQARFAVVPLALPAAEPQRILVLGDTGCRIKGTALQDCSDPTAWPFPKLAAAAARLRPDLVIHVGDYLYRENACPADFKGCQGTPFGDNWPTWDADFFAPAAPLLAAAPWVIVRGNHEDCNRAGQGFLRLLGPDAFDPAASCRDHLKPYSVALAGLNLVVADNANAPETAVADKVVPVYTEEFASLAKEPAPTWLLQHRPIWGLITGPLGIPAGGNLTEMAALGDGDIAAPVELMLSGHIHTFEAINYRSEKRVPPQVVAGFGGDLLDPTPLDLKGAIFQGSSGVHVADGISVGGFGFLLMTKLGADWTIDVYDVQGRVTHQCRFVPAAAAKAGESKAVGRVDCPDPAVTQKRRR